MRKRIYQILNASENDRASRIYNSLMVFFIIISVIPLAFKEPGEWSVIIDEVTVTVFIIDYILRLATADYYYDDHSIKSFIKYPFSFMAIIDLLSILPSLAPVNSGLKLLRLFRMTRALRVIRVFKVLRYSKNMAIITEVIRRSKNSLMAVWTLAVGYILIAALVIFNIEPETFDRFFDAVYWAAVSLTTVGYGDIYATSDPGKLITIISSLVGIAIVALPSGIITAGYLSIVNEQSADNKDDTDGHE